MDLKKIFAISFLFNALSVYGLLVDGAHLTKSIIKLSDYLDVTYSLLYGIFFAVGLTFLFYGLIAVLLPIVRQVDLKKSPTLSLNDALDYIEHETHYGASLNNGRKKATIALALGELILDRKLAVFSTIKGEVSTQTRVPKKVLKSCENGNLKFKVEGETDGSSDLRRIHNLTIEFGNKIYENLCFDRSEIQKEFPS